MMTEPLLFDSYDDYIPVSCCFKDKKRRIHLVLVVHSENIDEKLEVFLENLKLKGVHVEEDFGVYDNKIKFFKLHLPEEKATALAKAYQIDCCYERRQFWTQQKKPRSYLRSFFNLSESLLTAPSHRNPMHQMSTFELTTAPRTIIYSEVIYVLYKLMNETYFGDKPFEIGVDRLLHKKVALSVYSLHEGQWQWTSEGNVTSRQILSKYWSNSKVWYKPQPLNAVMKYFGTEVSHFFGLLGFYIKLVYPLAIAGIVCALYGLMTLNTVENQASREVCGSNIILCPRCQMAKCNFKFLNAACFSMRMTYLVDNAGSFVYGLFVLFWAMIFHRLWLRRKNTYAFMWNVDKGMIDIAMRLEYEKKAKSKKISYFTGLEEPHMPVKEKVLRLAVSWTILALLVFSIWSASLLSAMMRVWYELHFSELETKQDMYVVAVGSKFNANLVNSLTSSLCVLLMTEFYRYLSNILTKFEYPRTKAEFGYSYVIKLYALEFANHYGSLFYTAFVKGRLYTYPGDQLSNSVTYILRTDHCSIAGCLNDLNINLLIRIWFFIGRSLIKPYFKRLLILIRLKGKKIPYDVLPQWEADYYLLKVSEKYIINRQLKMVIIHGYMTLFALVCPLAPFFILIYALIELRGEAKQYIRHYRRPILTKMHTSTVWNDIFKLTAYIGVVTNACILAFTTTFVERELYRHSENSSLYGFFNSTLSVFDVTRLTRKFQLQAIPVNLRQCYYPGKRFPPGHPRQYQRREHFWIEYFYKFLVVIVVEHLVLTVTTILEVISSPIPYEIKQRMRLEWIQKKEGQRV